MNVSFADRLRTVEVLDARQAGTLQVFGLRWQHGGVPSYRTLDEALAAGTFEVRELSEGGSVPQLKVINKGDTPVFLMAGEQLIGAKQNRILNTSLLAPANADLTVPVSCVEAHRWSYRSPKFGSAGTLSHGKLRKLLKEHTHEGYMHGAGAVSRQGEVWSEVDRKLKSVGSVSPSAALQQAYEDHENRMHDMLGTLTVSPDWCGVAVVLAGQVVGVDLFDQPETLTKLWPKIVRAFAIDALEQTETATQPLSSEQVTGWLRSAADGTVESYKSPGLGYDVRLKGAGVIGGSLVVDDQPLHAELFAV